jgi:hypothetical protein
MVMKPEPLFRAVEAIAAERGTPSAVVLMTPQGRRFSHAEAERLSRLERIIVICGGTKAWTSASPGARDRRDFDRRLRAVGRRSCPRSW